MVQFIDYDPSGVNPAVTYGVTAKKGRTFSWHRPKFRWLKSKKLWIPLTAILIVILVPGYFFLFRPGQELVDAFNQTKAAASAVSKDVEKQDVLAADRDLPIVADKLNLSRQKLDYFGFTNNFPWLGDYYRDSRHLLLAGQYGVNAGQVITEALKPFADILNPAGGASVTTEQKIQTLLPVMPKLAPATKSISEKLDLVRQELVTVDPNRYPDSFQGLTPKQTLKDAKSLIDEIDEFMPQAKDVLLTLPQALGSPTPKKYFVLFQNDKELRPTGGFLTAYTYMTLNKGAITTSGSENITKIDDNMSRKFPAPSAILKYLPLVTVWNPRDANLSPDFVTSMQKFESLASYSSAYSKNDGIIAVDTFLLQDLLRLTGPVKVASTGDTFDADNVVVKMETYAEQVFSNSNYRKAFLGELMKEVIHRLLSAGKDKWQPIITTALNNGNEKHFLLYSHDPTVQVLVERYNWGGRIKDFSGDYLHLNDTNFAGAKANLYIKEKIRQDITVDKDGTVTKKVTVDITNPAKADGFLNGTYRDWIRMYVPKGSELIKYEGGEVKTTATADELGKTMFESFVLARPLGFSGSNKATWSVTYKLPFKATGKELKILEQKQPGVDGPDLTITLNGKVKVSEQLRTDKEFTIALD